MALTNGATRTDKARVLDFLSKTIHDPSISRWVSLYKKNQFSNFSLFGILRRTPKIDQENFYIVQKFSTFACLNFDLNLCPGDFSLFCTPLRPFSLHLIIFFPKNSALGRQLQKSSSCCLTGKTIVLT